MAQRNTEFRTWKTCPYIEVNRDGEVRYRKGRERYENGKLIRPDEWIQDSQRNRRPVQWMIFKAFPDIPLRYAPESWKTED